LRKQAAARHRRLQRLDWCHDRTVAGGPPPNGKEHPRLADTQPAAFPSGVLHKLRPLPSVFANIRCGFATASRERHWSLAIATA
jgi:hypothetical protein